MLDIIPFDPSQSPSLSALATEPGALHRIELDPGLQNAEGLVNDKGLIPPLSEIEPECKDSVTGMLNLAGLNKYGKQLFDGAIARGQSVLTFVTDLDGFKLVNDALGHDAGDGVLRESTDSLHLSATLARMTQDVHPDHRDSIMTEVHDLFSRHRSTEGFGSSEFLAERREHAADLIVARHGGDEMVLMVAVDTLDNRVAAMKAGIEQRLRDFNVKRGTIDVGLRFGMSLAHPLDTNSGQLPFTFEGAIDTAKKLADLEKINQVRREIRSLGAVALAQHKICTLTTGRSPYTGQEETLREVSIFLTPIDVDSAIDRLRRMMLESINDAVYSTVLNIDYSNNSDPVLT